MQCGADDLLCQAATWISHNEFVASFLTERLASFGVVSSGAIRSVALLVKEYGQSVFGAFGVAFGAWRWWKYRELILHERLKEYIKVSDNRLVDAERDVINAIRRPGPAYPVTLPLFSSVELRSVLRERNWDKTPYALTIESSADCQLERAVETINRQIKNANDCLESLKRQSATAHLLRGAIASCAAVRRDAQGHTLDRQAEALNFYRVALTSDEKNVLAKELEALQLRKLGQYSQALQSFRDLETIADGIADHRARTIVIARARRYRAEILQRQTLFMGAQNSPQFQGAMGANNLLSQSVVGSALALRAPLSPFSGWDLLEHGDIGYTAAFVSRNLNFNGMVTEHLAIAEAAYRGLQRPVSFWTALKGRRYRQLRRLAKEGLERVIRARDEDQFDAKWLSN